jgi:hypothetical protein
VLKTIAILLFFAGVIAVARTGYYGGKLVYENAAGVQFNLGSDFSDVPEQGENN